MKKVILVVFTCLLLGLNIGCTTKESMTTVNISAEQTVRDYFKYWNEKDLTNLEKTMVSDRKGITWEFEKLEYVKLLNIKEKESNEKDKKVFQVEFEIKFKDGYGSGLNDGKWNWNYMLKQNEQNSQWLIYDWGV
jgi:hypothetical protein